MLTVNQVFEILLRYTENQSWKKSFFDVIPRRKGITESSSSNGDANAQNDKAGQEIFCNISEERAESDEKVLIPKDGC